MTKSLQRFLARIAVWSLQKRLLQLVKEHQLCPKLCSFEQSKEECFSYQLKRCHGACVHEEKSADYNVRVLQAVDTFAASHGEPKARASSPW